MYEKIKKDISQEYYVKNYPNDGQRFVAWYLRNIHNLDTFEARACITDGAGDKQIDAVMQKVIKALETQLGAQLR